MLDTIPYTHNIHTVFKLRIGAALKAFNHVKIIISVYRLYSDRLFHAINTHKRQFKRHLNKVNIFYCCVVFSCLI